MLTVLIIQSLYLLGLGEICRYFLGIRSCYFSLTFIIGLLGNWIFSNFCPLSYSILILGSIFGILVLIKYGWMVHKDLSKRRYLFLSFFSLLILFFFFMMNHPFSGWDARSIWFFHAKIIYYAKSLINSDWSYAPIGFSHPDYPKIVPLVAAQMGIILGTWNEYLPNMAIFLTIVPLFGILFPLLDKRPSSFWLVLALFASTGLFPYGGYMDAIMALYGAIAALVFLHEKIYSEHIKIGVILIGMVTLFKNEGLLLGFLLLFYYFLQLIFSIGIKKALTIFLQQWKLLIFAILPISIWILQKKILGLSNDMSLGTQKSLICMLNRIFSGEIFLILKSLFYIKSDSMPRTLWASIFLGLWTLPVLYNHCSQLKMKIFYPLSVSISYFIALLLVYLQTPNDLKWHLETSADRTTLPIVYLIWVCIFIVMRWREDKIIV